jgi:hypothetical protein
VILPPGSAADPQTLGEELPSNAIKFSGAEGFRQLALYFREALAFADVCLGRKEESIQEGRRAVEMRPISKDAIDGVVLAGNMAMVYACANQLDSAFEQLDTLAKMPVALTYADLKLNPGGDPLRKDPRFDKLLAELAPRD